jgi:threonylcarbamoyladenosine tRNA methylthiotransferase MtaB
LEQAIADAKRLAEEGYLELTITGIEISSWGHDLKNGLSLIDLLEGVCQAAPGLRVRLGSLEPRTITEEFCARASKLPNLCPHFHLSLQSGCDATLKRMNRKYDTARYLESCTLLRQYFREPAITTDLITGFPGETEEEFSATLDFIQKVNFSAMHIFPYSRRTGTKAADMEGQVLNEVKEERAHRAIALAAQMEDGYLAKFAEETVEVLFEEEKEGQWRGHTPNYLEVRVVSDQPLHNQLRRVKASGVGQGCLLGALAD